MSTLLLSDLHLPPHPSPLREAFTGFLKGAARHAEAVYILGDLFEVWVGDDDGLRTYAAECEALHQLSRTVSVFFMHGNRDFLIGDAFAAATGVRLLDDPIVLDLYGTRTLLSHGDIFCTDDVGYQRWRRFSRRRWIQRGYHSLPLILRKAVVSRVRSTSLVQKRSKAEDIMDVNTRAIDAAFAEHKVSRMIHGHTHRPAEHQHASGERIVLADWRPGDCEYLRVATEGISRVKIAVSA
ncbi:MAG: UDP-2,3-diacylglucosamine diphosphatase [Pseudomonadota bacterium]